MSIKKLSLILAVCLLSCVLGSTVLAAQKTINFGYLVADQLHSPAVMVIKQKKLFEAAGLTVNWKEYLAGAYAMQDMASGAIEFATSGCVPAMITDAQGVKLAILASSNAEGSSLVVSKKITKVSDLDGKKIGTPGIGSIQDAMVAQLAAVNKINIKRMTMKVSDMPLFLSKGEIDGFIAWAPHPSRAVSQGFGHILLNSHEMMPGHQCCVLITTDKMLKDDNDTVKKIVKIYLDAYKWCLDNQKEAIAMVAQATGMTEDVVADAMKTVKYPFPPYPDIPSMEKMAIGLIETGKMTTVTLDGVKKFVEGIYRPEILNSLVNSPK